MANTKQGALIMLHREPPNWVKGLADCRIDLKFMELRQIVERDVDEFNKLSSEQRFNRVFSFHDNDEGINPSFTVEELKDKRRAANRSMIVFSIEGHNIVINGNGKSVYLVPFWHFATLSCKLMDRQTNRNFDVWEVSQIALAALFFPSHSE